MGAGRRHSGPVSLFGPFYHRYLVSALLPGGLGTVALCFPDQKQARQHGSIITLVIRAPVLTDVRV